MNEIRKSYGKVIQKTVAVICLLSLLLSLGAITASAQGAAKIVVSSSTVERGDNASISFNLEGNPGIWGLKLRIHYDHSALTLKSVTTGSVFSRDEIVMSESLSKDPYVIMASGGLLENKTSDGTIVTLNFTVSSNAALESYPITAEISQANNVNSDKVNIGADNGSVSVVACKHANQEWRVTAAAGCEKPGTEALTCKKCEAVFNTRTVTATGHLHTEIRNAVAATKTANGYTGDTYCIDCVKLISKGKTIAKLSGDAPVTNPSVRNPSVTNPSVTNPSVTNPPVTSASVTNSSETTGSTDTTDENKPIITSGENLTFSKDSDDSLVFVSNADFSEFIRVEIDGKTLDENDFTAESGSTIITIDSAFLSKLSAGEHTVSIVSKSGTASAEFTVQNESDTSDADTVTDMDSDKPSVDASDDTDNKSSATPIIITVVIVVILAGGVAAFFIIKRRRSM